MIYEEDETRGFLKLKLITIGLTIALIVGLAAALTSVAAIPAIVSFVGTGPAWTEAAVALRWPIIFVIGIGGIAALFRYGPDRSHARWRWLTPGAALGCVLWVIGTYGFSFYVQSFGNYNETFGALAGVVVLLTWLWLSAFVVLLGALLDTELEAQTKRDSTTGPNRPLGERGAVKADTVGAARTGADDREEPSPAISR